MKKVGSQKDLRTCSNCGKKFKSEWRLRKHLHEDHGVLIDNPCNNCLNVTQDEGELLCNFYLKTDYFLSDLWRNGRRWYCKHQIYHIHTWIFLKRIRFLVKQCGEKGVSTDFYDKYKCSECGLIKTFRDKKKEGVEWRPHVLLPEDFN